MHLQSVSLHPDRFPTRAAYPFSLPVVQDTGRIDFDRPVTFFVGENGSGKSTLLEAICRRCDIHVWRDQDTQRSHGNRHQGSLWQSVSVQWADGRVPGAFFGSDIFRYFAECLDDWARSDPAQFDYFGGRSLRTLSHGQSLMAFFRHRTRLRGLYLLDEPETALSPRTQIELLELISAAARAGHAQFIIASHSPILLSCPGARLYSFDRAPVHPVRYEDTDHYRVYRDFLLARDEALAKAPPPARRMPHPANAPDR